MTKMSDGKESMVCPFHNGQEKLIEKHDTLIHKLDKKVDRFFILGSLQLIALIVILCKLFEIQ